MKATVRDVPVMTLTDELYLPSRLIFDVCDVTSLRAWLKKTPCMQWDPTRQRWTWNYTGAARKLKFPPAYDQLPVERQPIVLASCYLINDQTMHVYTNCPLRIVKFLVFFDKNVSRSIAMGTFLDEYTLITTVPSGAYGSIPRPEDYFKDESRIEFIDIADLMDMPESGAKAEALKAHFADAQKRTLAPLTRKRLELFYADGEAAMKQVMKFRETMALIQHQSKEPIRPFEEIMRALRK